jgi:RimJ/RimL family protein N-acetyltransferase
MITIGFLADHLDTIPTLVIWFHAQWPEYHAAMSDEEMRLDFLEDASYDRLPIRLIAFESNQLVGTIILRDTALPPEFQPELGGLYVIESHRGQGVATELVRAGMQLAHKQGYETVFATTVVAAGILKRLGWEFLKTFVHEAEELHLYRCKL